MAAAAAVKNLIQDSRANVHTCVRHNIISSCESMTFFFFFTALSLLFPALDGNGIPESCNLEAVQKDLKMLTVALML